MLNKSLIGGTIAEIFTNPKLGIDFQNIRIESLAEIRLSKTNTKRLNTTITVVAPKLILPPSLEAGNQLYMDCVYLPANTLNDKQDDGIIWANTVHLVTVKEGLSKVS